jgi:hypothetical protein
MKKSSKHPIVTFSEEQKTAQALQFEKRERLIQNIVYWIMPYGQTRKGGFIRYGVIVAILLGIAFTQLQHKTFPRPCGDPEPNTAFENVIRKSDEGQIAHDRAIALMIKNRNIQLVKVCQFSTGKIIDTIKTPVFHLPAEQLQQILQKNRKPQ